MTSEMGLNERCRLLVGSVAEVASVKGLPVAISVVDVGGRPLDFHRMAGAPYLAIEASNRKAITAAGFGLSTGDDWNRFVGDDELLRRGLTQLTDFTWLPGGVPLYIGGRLVGGIGVAGGHYSEDLECLWGGLRRVDLFDDVVQ
jgi:uncharacterized protein GlcG (DUF336 family)